MTTYDWAEEGMVELIGYGDYVSRSSYEEVKEELEKLQEKYDRLMELLELTHHYVKKYYA